MTTLAPCSDSSSAVARPMPRAEPVTIATLSSRTPIPRKIWGPALRGPPTDYGLVVLEVNVSVFEYAPVRSGSVDPMCWVKLIVTGTVETGADHVDFLKPTCSASGSENAPFVR